MALLAYCGQAIRSELPLPELPPSSLFAPDIDVGLSPGRPPPALQWEHDESNWFRHRQGPASLRVRFPELCDFVLSEQSRRVDCEPHPGCDEESLRHLLLDQVLPLALAQRGELVLHASAAAIDGCCVAILGGSGSGKSTLNAFLCSQGFPGLSDDCLLIEQRGDRPHGVPSYPALRLWPDAVPLLAGVQAATRPMAAWGTKQVVSLDPRRAHFCSAPVPVGAFYLLGPESAEVEIAALPPRDGLVALTRHLFHLRRANADLHASLFERVGDLAAAVPLRSLSFPRDFQRLPEVARRVTEDLRGLVSHRR